MPVLTPSYLPPAPEGVSPSTSPASSSAASRTTSLASSQDSTAPTSPEGSTVDKHDDAQEKPERALKIPFIKLGTPVISEDMAASLAVSLLGHVLFLKSQVPFPVAQLGRLPAASSASRAVKKRVEMMNAVDVLSSHLHTTFSALSAALAQNPGHGSTDTVYFAFVLGPTIGAPRARVVLALEGLEIKIWGEREDSDEIRESSQGSQGEVESDRSSSDGEDEDNEGSEEKEDSSSDAADSLADTYDDASEPPSSPPPSEPSSSRSFTPFSDVPSQPSSPAPRNAGRALRLSLSPLSAPSSSALRPHLAPRPLHTHAEEQQTLRAAERLLARTLANASAEGSGIANELAPTQTHVLVRAPRRFSHPAWLPRQNASASLDGMLHEFLVESGMSEGAQGKPRRRAGVNTEGVLVTCKDGPESGSATPRPAGEGTSEEDELIWWVWDGKLTGFAEW
ncbi:hypothetical protein BC834DRAFT_865971 [Gloeopeniophorella convolvens]|nr:hypothetical protein BC834DRAFT_865971 [Gloeopeniophorella convolvens]